MGSAISISRELAQLLELDGTNNVFISYHPLNNEVIIRCTDDELRGFGITRDENNQTIIFAVLRSDHDGIEEIRYNPTSGLATITYWEWDREKHESVRRVLSIPASGMAVNIIEDTNIFEITIELEENKG